MEPELVEKFLLAEGDAHRHEMDARGGEELIGQIGTGIGKQSEDGSAALLRAHIIDLAPRDGSETSGQREEGGGVIGMAMNAKLLAAAGDDQAIGRKLREGIAQAGDREIRTAEHALAAVAEARIVRNRLACRCGDERRGLLGKSRLEARSPPAKQLEHAGDELDEALGPGIHHPGGAKLGELLRGLGERLARALERRLQRRGEIIGTFARLLEELGSEGAHHRQHRAFAGTGHRRVSRALTGRGRLGQTREIEAAVGRRGGAEAEHVLGEIAPELPRAPSRMASARR